MKELSDILSAVEQFGPDVAAALATVVRVEGSSYRRPGARMLISADGRIVGGVSGGCLERDVVQRAGAVMASGKAIVVRYDTTPDFDTGAGYSLGCGGTIDVLVEPLGNDAGLKLLSMLKAFSTQSSGAISTVVAPRNHPKLGSHRECDPDAITPGNTAIRSERTPDGTVELFVEHIRPPLHLLIFGAGNDAVPLAGLGKSMGWRVTVVDVRSTMLNLNQQWSVDAFVRCGIDEVPGKVSIGDFTAAVVMTHNFGHDRQLMDWLASESLAFLGLLGAKHRTNELLSRLRTPPPLLHAPVGLDIGAANPEEVALSIVAEITAVIRGRSPRTPGHGRQSARETECSVAGS